MRRPPRTMCRSPNRYRRSSSKPMRRWCRCNTVFRAPSPSAISGRRRCAPPPSQLLPDRNRSIAMTRMLFREEAVAAQGERSLGDVMVAAPPGARLFTVIALLITVALIGYAYFGHYTRKAHVSGYLAPDQGLIKVHAPGTGTLIAKQVTEGQSVKQGDTLFILSTERGSPETPAAQQSAIESLVQRRDSVRGELLDQTRIDTDHKRNLQERLRCFEQELQQLDAALATP